MEILYFFQEKGTPMYQWQRVHFIDELSRHGVHFTYINPLAYSTAEEANEALLAHVKENQQYDLFLTNICYHRAIFPETIDLIKAIGIPTLCFRSDNLVIPYIDRITGPHFDLLWLTSSDTQYLYDKWNIKTVFLPYAANPYHFTFYDNVDLSRNVCFVGTPYGSRPIMINTLTSNNVRTEVYYKKVSNRNKKDEGPVLKSAPILPYKYQQSLEMLLFHEGRKAILGKIKNKIFVHAHLDENECLISLPVVPQDDLPKIYSKHVLALASTSAWSTDVLTKPLHVLNLRAFEIPMCGGIQLCKYCDELANYFIDGKEVVLYHNNEELVDKARYYTQKASDTEINQMKRAARLKAENEHTWWSRFTKAFDLIGVKY